MSNFEFGRTGNSKNSLDFSLELSQTSRITVHETGGLISYQAESRPSLEEINLPASIFSNLSALQAIVRYLKDLLHLDFSDIAKLINRDQRTIWSTYHSASKIALRVEESLPIPLSVFADRKLSTLEALVVYLKRQDMKFVDIGRLLQKDQRTVWTAHNRALKKLE